MKYCVFIPTIPSRFNKLENLVNLYNAGTVKPDEIIINASSVNSDNYNILINLFNKNIHNLKIIPHRTHLEAGPNRQMAQYISQSDVIVYQDDDDLPSDKRLEIIKSYFETMDIVCLNHGYVYNDILPELKNISIIESQKLYEHYFPNGILEECKHYNSYGDGFFPICAGPVSIKKNVLNVVQWKEKCNITLTNFKAEDFQFCMEVLHKFNKSLLIDSKIYQYLKG
jgi:hypothetical protein